MYASIYTTWLVQAELEELSSASQHERDLLSRLSPDVVCQLIDSVFNELVAEFKVSRHHDCVSPRPLPLAAASVADPKGVDLTGLLGEDSDIKEDWGSGDPSKVQGLSLIHI